jgi:hypothetical protein
MTPSPSSTARRKQGKGRAAVAQVLSSPALRSAPKPAREWLARLLAQGERASGPDVPPREGRR